MLQIDHTMESSRSSIQPLGELFCTEASVLCNATICRACGRTLGPPSVHCWRGPLRLQRPPACLSPCPEAFLAHPGRSLWRQAVRCPPCFERSRSSAFSHDCPYLPCSRPYCSSLVNGCFDLAFSPASFWYAMYTKNPRNAAVPMYDVKRMDVVGLCADTTPLRCVTMLQRKGHA